MSLILIVWNNLKKKKHDVAVVILLIMLASCFLYISISILANNKSVFEKAYQNCNTADYIYITAEPEKERIEEVFKSQKEVEEVEVTPAIFYTTTYYGDKDKTEQEFMFLLENMEEERQIGQIPAIKKERRKKNSILVPYYFKVGMGYQAGDTLSIKLGNQYYEFEIIDFVEDPLYATPINISLYKCYLTEEAWQEIKKEQPTLKNVECLEYKVKLKPSVSSAAFEENILPLIASVTQNPKGRSTVGLNWETMSNGGTMVSNIGMGILLVFSILIVLIIVLIVRFSIRNFIYEDIKNIGILQAIGYTSNKLQATVLLEMSFMSGIGIFLGLLLGYASRGILANIQGAFIGLSWPQNFDLKTAAIVVVCLFSFHLLLAVGCSRIYRNILVLEALRGGIQTHNFQKNYLPLEKSKFSLQVNLAFKNILAERLKNFSIFCIITLLSIVSCIGFYIYQSFGMDSSNLLKLVGIETATIMATGEKKEPFSEIAKEVEKIPGIRQALLYEIVDIKLSNAQKHTTISCDVWSNPEKIENGMLIEGRFPMYDNELVVTSVIAKELGVKVGDILYIERDGEKIDYILVGIDQKISSLGRRAMLNIEGAKRFQEKLETSTLYIYTEEGIKYQDIVKPITEKFPGLELTDSSKIIEDSVKTIKVLLQLLCTLFVIITLCVVILTIFLVTKSKMIQEKHNYGVYKALGFTSRQLMTQSILMVLPVIIVASIFGAILSLVLAEPIMVLCLSVCNIQKCNIIRNPIWMIFTILGIILTAWITVISCSLRIRKIQPVNMISGE